MKAWAFILVVALLVSGSALPAGAAKIQLTDQEMDAVGAGDSSVAVSQVGLGSASGSSFSSGIDGITNTTARANFANVIPVASASGSNAITSTHVGNKFVLDGTAMAGTNVPPFGIKEDIAEITVLRNPGQAEFGCRGGVCVLLLKKH